MPRVRRLLPALLAVALIGSTSLSARQAGAQPQPLRFARPDALLSVPFVNISAIHELPDGRVILLEESEQQLVLADFARGTAAAFGRKGGGPAEYRSVGSLLSRADGGVLISDAVQRRLLPVAPDGAFRNPIRVPVSMLAATLDVRDHVYADAFMARTGAGPRDSMWILRWHVASDAVDTLMAFDAAVTKSVRPAGSARPVFPAIDSWTALPNGDVVVVSAASYRVTVYRNGTSVQSFTIPFTPLRMTAAERLAYSEEQAAAPRRTLGGGGGSGARPAPSRASAGDITYDFPATYPVFGGHGLGGRYLRVSADGMLWVERAVPPGARLRHYDVVDVGRGRQVARLELPAKSSIVGFGRRGVYVTERSDDDEQFLRRYRYPVLPPR